MQVLTSPWGAAHYRVDGPEGAPTVMFANSLGTDLRLWDKVLGLLPPHRAIRFDKRGHGLSDQSGPYVMADLAEDAAALIEAEARGPVVMVGLSIGGCVAQTLALRRPDLVRAVALSNTAAKMGTAESWRARIEAIRKGGLESIAEAVMERWFAPAFRATPELALWRNMLTGADVEGYAAACGALAAFDLTAEIPALRQPCLVIAGAEDGASPPDLVAATARLIPGAQFHVIPGAGHLPCVETPEAWAAIVAPFLTEHAR